MNKIESLKSFLTDDQILECLVLFDDSKIEGSKLLRSFLFDKWRITTVEAIKIMQDIHSEFNKRP